MVYLSTTYDAWDTPFWSGTLDLIYLASDTNKEKIIYEGEKKLKHSTVYRVQERESVLYYTKELKDHFIEETYVKWPLDSV